MAKASKVQVQGSTYHGGLKLIVGGLVLKGVGVFARQAPRSTPGWMHPVVIQLCTAYHGQCRLMMSDSSPEPVYLFWGTIDTTTDAAVITKQGPAGVNKVMK